MARLPKIWHLQDREIFVSRRLPLHVRRHTRVPSHVPHDHDFWEIVFVLSGTGRHLTIYGESTLLAGDVFILRPGVWHAYRDCKALNLYNCCFAASLLHHEMASVFHEPVMSYLFFSTPLDRQERGPTTLRLSAPALKTCRGHLQTLERSLSEKHSPHAPLEQMGHLVLLFSQIAQIAGCAHRSMMAKKPPLHPALKEAMRLLEDEYSHAWTLAELASRLYLNPSYLVRLFQNGAGISPMNYLARRRAERAAGLLLRTEETISKIGEQIGWSDPNYFARRFKAHFGVSASEYRAQFVGLHSSAMPEEPRS